MDNEKQYRRQLTYSGDYYSATRELWEEYWVAVESDNWGEVERLETGQNPDFQYDP